MEMPQPDERHHELARLAGTWEGEDTMPPSEWAPDGSVAAARMHNRVALGEFVVVSDYAQTADGRTTYEGHGVYTIDGDSGEVLLHWFDNLGGLHEEFRGGWDGDRLTLRSHSSMMGQMRLVLDLSEEGLLKQAMESSRDGDEWSSVFVGTYAKTR